MEENAIAKAFGLLQEEKPKGQTNVSDAAISKLLNEEEADLQLRRSKKQGMSCAKLPCPRIHNFIADAVAIKGNNCYISETLFGLFHGKAKYGHKINVVKEVATHA